MNTIQNLGSTGIYAYTTLISVFICAPGVYFFEPGVWAAIKQQVRRWPCACGWGVLPAPGGAGTAKEPVG